MPSMFATHYGEKREGLAPVLKCRWIVLAAFLAAASGQAAAQDDGGICTIATTCSEAFFQCVVTRCPPIQKSQLHGRLQITIR